MKKIMLFCIVILDTCLYTMEKQQIELTDKYPQQSSLDALNLNTCLAERYTNVIKLRRKEKKNETTYKFIGNRTQDCIQQEVIICTKNIVKANYLRIGRIIARTDFSVRTDWLTTDEYIFTGKVRYKDIESQGYVQTNLSFALAHHLWNELNRLYYTFKPS